jgi:enamine deaminase RidA (YjgF/YER057c/UK114 family)
MLRHDNPRNVAAPAGRYSHSVEVPPGARWLHIAGQVGVAPDGKLAEGFEAQADQAWRNLKGVLEAAGMGMGDLVKITYYLLDPAHVAIARKVRDRYITDPPPASTLVIAKGLATPALLFEIEGVAAKG